MKSRVIFLFPGQSAQTIGMGVSFIEHCSTARRLCTRAEELLGWPLERLLRKGPLRELSRTDRLQPALSLVNAVCLAAFSEECGAECEAVAGLSLGELSALYSAEVLAFDDFILIAALRGELMHRAAEQHPGGMLAVRGLEPSRTEELLQEAKKNGVISSANLNSPDQLVLSGEHPALHAAREAALRLGANRAELLKVSGPWHSPLMADAQEKFAAALATVEFGEAAVPVYSNVTAEPSCSPVVLRANLVSAITNPTLWAASMERMRTDYPAAHYVELGPGRVLKGLALSIERSTEIYSIEDSRSLSHYRTLPDRAKLPACDRTSGSKGI